jgi:hypothetical protein
LPPRLRVLRAPWPALARFDFPSLSPQRPGAAASRLRAAKYNTNKAVKP